MNNVLVCITPQTNSRRLIDRAVLEVEALKGELHILNIQKGDTVFINENSAELLEELFSYGSKRGGIVHALAGEDIPDMIQQFSKKNEIARIIVGETIGDTLKAQKAGIIERLSDMLRGIEIVIVPRENN